MGSASILLSYKHPMLGYLRPYKREDESHPLELGFPHLPFAGLCIQSRLAHKNMQSRSKPIRFAKTPQTDLTRKVERSCFPNSARSIRTLGYPYCCPRPCGFKRKTRFIQCLPDIKLKNTEGTLLLLMTWHDMM